MQIHNDRQCYEQLFNAFSGFLAMSERLKAEIVTRSKIIRVRKKQILLNATETSNHIYFIISGAIRIFYLNRDGEQSNTWFLFENDLAISVYSFFTSEPSFEYMETMEPCTLIALNKQQLDWIYQNIVEFNIIGRKMTELYYIRNEAQANALRMLTATERYELLIKTSPQVLKRVSLSNISSYLGISAETLSRIRKKH